ncbi:MAG: hypothetical protein JW808_03770, partial [Victivallales bacterium]|nr:hypothetical protein [Victivallales bacterium]
YPLDKVIPNLVSKIPGRGPKVDGTFQEYKSAAGADEVEIEYCQVDFEIFKKGSSDLKEMKDKPVKFKANLGSKTMSWLLEQAPRENYTCYMILAPGKSEPTRDSIYAYFSNGSEALKAYERLFKKAKDYNSKGGVVFKGRVSYLGKDSYSYPAGIIIDHVER